MNGRWQLVTGPVLEPLTTAEVKLHLRVDGSTEDALIDLYAKAARQAVEDACWVAMLTQTWDYLLDAWPAGNEIELPRPPLQSVTSITYRDADGAIQTFAATNYRVDASGLLGRVVLKPSAQWPTAALDTGSPIAVRFMAGYTAAANVPQLMRSAVLLLTGELYQQREAAAAGALAETPAIARLLNLVKVRY